MGEEGQSSASGLSSDVRDGSGREEGNATNRVRTMLNEIVSGWPDLLGASKKLMSKEGLDKEDVELLKELARASGWEVEDIAEDIRFSGLDPSKRAKRYGVLFAQYFEEVKRNGRNVNGQAVERLWGATTALVKWYAAVNGAPVVQWSFKSLSRALEGGFEEGVEVLNDLLDMASFLRRCARERNADREDVRRRWAEAVARLEEARRLLKL